MHRPLLVSCVALLVGLLLVVVSQADSVTPVEVDPRETIEQRGGLAGTLIPDRRTARPGKRIGVRVKNTGRRTMIYGLGFQLQRREGGEWRRVRDPFVSSEVNLPAFALQPGEKAGPRYTRHLVDRFRLKRDVEPGTYRAIKVVSRDRPQRPHLRLNGTFRITPVDWGRVAR